MSLEAIVDFTKKEKKFCLAASTFVVSRVTDLASTLLCFSKFGNEVEGRSIEANPLINQFVDAYGVTGGLLLENVLFGGLILSLCYYFNKRSTVDKANKYLYLGAASGLALTINNSYYLF